VWVASEDLLTGDSLFAFSDLKLGIESVSLLTIDTDLFKIEVP
jgi:hypothetical protein